MKIRLLFLLLPLSLSGGQAGGQAGIQAGGQDRFLQEIATVFTPANGLPEAVYSAMRTRGSGEIIAVSAVGEFIYDGESWKNLNGKPSGSGRKQDTPSSGAGKKKAPVENVLSTTRYQDKVFIGRENGLFMQGNGDDEWIEVFPSDGHYSWKLSNVSVLLAEQHPF